MGDIQQLVRQNIRELKPYSSARDEFSNREGVFLDANENPYGELNRYPDPYQTELKKELAALKKVDKNQLFIGNGSDEIIDLAFRVFCEPSKDKALTFSPTYGMYDVSAAINDVELIKVPLGEDFNISLEALEPYWSQKDIKLIFICSPNNPTANIFRKSDIEQILLKFDGIVIIDEAYIDFSESESWITELNNYPRLMITQTFSKAWGLAATRVGVAYAQNEIVQWLNKVKPPYNVSELNQKAAIEAISNLDQFEQNRKAILAEKTNLEKALKEYPFIEKIYPSDSNFILIRVTNANTVYQYLVKQNVIIRNRHSLVNNCVRITVGTKQENQKLLSALKTIEL